MPVASFDDAKCVCPSCIGDLHEPVCGSDGKSYASRCYLHKASCQSEKSIVVVKKEPCGKFLHFD